MGIHPDTCWSQDTVTGFLLAGVGNVDLRRKSNFLVVTESETSHCCNCMHVIMLTAYDAAIMQRLL